MKRRHPMPFGAEVREDGSVRFRLWAPKAKKVKLIAGQHDLLPMDRSEDGWHELITNRARAGSRYQYRIDDEINVPDPASRFQPEDVHAPSEVIDPARFEWNDEGWSGRPWEEAVLYELHVGTFTSEGTYAAARQKLDYLTDLGITAVELMPVADFPGKRNWGYDGVLPYAPDSSYGTPDDLKRLVQAAHQKGLMVFLDVVYNHFGPDGNYLRSYAPDFFSSRHCTPWGDGINFDGPGSRVVRDFFIHNALYWLEEYHFDGLRLDAVHAIVDDSRPHILSELAETVRARLGNERKIHLVLENGDNAAKFLERDEDGRPREFDAQWDDDIHHALHVLISGETDGYYCDYAADPVRQLGRCLTEGFAFQGDFSGFHKAQRGEPSSHLPPTAFVSFLQNHDQIGNRAFGDRLVQVASREALKAATAIVRLAPLCPLMFMGDEFGAETPFLFFCDFSGELAKAVTEGRRNEFAHFTKFASSEVRLRIPDPNAEATFQRSKLDWKTVKEGRHANWLEFSRQLLGIRQNEILPLLRDGKKPCTKLETIESRGLAVDWQFSSGALSLRANLGNESATGFPVPGGRAVYATHANILSDLKKGTMPPWSVIWCRQS